ncbi:MAG: hypothetical protein A2583_07635 [Bdellovibrionales bacterium RIFOXYD1_FULL_53_11]|nr:MAG: hypothetical protein A2583_07635 [Bdellovibrionales bacterium RIFOXYD1_FULL_53_11]
MKRSRDFPNPASTTPGTIVLYDDAFSDKRNLARVLAHELLHEYFRGMTKNDAESYRMTTNWYRFGDADGKVRWITRGRDSFVENDGMTSPDEDFANNVEYFLFERNKLKTTTPNAEGWISRRFGPGFRLRGAK